MKKPKKKQTKEDKNAFIAEILDDLFDTVMQNEHRLSYTKKGKIWKRKIFVLSKSEREATKKKKKLENHCLKPGCQTSCRKKCVKNIEESRRLEIHKQFWTLSNNDQKKFTFKEKRLKESLEETKY